MKITIFGDVMWNYPLSLDSSLPIECNKKYVGGTLLNISVAAKKHFQDVHAIGIVGTQDYKIMNDTFIEKGLNPKLATAHEISTGACMLTYNNGLRTSIISFRQANMWLHYQSINIAEIMTSDFIFVNGWSFLPNSVTSKTLIKVINEATNKGIPVIFDILPHHIQEDELTVDYLYALERSSIVICETRARIMSQRTLNLASIKERCRWASLFIIFDWTRKYTVITSEGKCIAEEDTNYHNDAGIGFLDALALEQVVKYYHLARREGLGR